MFLLKAQNVGLTIGATPILHHLSFTLFPGELVGLLGPSGCGKSTLIRVLLGMMAPTTGTVQYQDGLTEPDGEQTRPIMGYVPQDDIVHPSLSIERAFYYSYLLRTGPDTSSEEAEKRVYQVMKILELTKRARMKIKFLSGGERKRVNLGIELLTDPNLLFLDEPTAGLDPYLERQMMKLFGKLTSQQRSLFVTTHLMANISLFDVLIFMAQGYLVFGGKSQAALQFFEVTDHERIYSKIRLMPAHKLAKHFRQSPFFAAFVGRQPPLVSGHASAREITPAFNSPETSIQSGVRAKEEAHPTSSTPSEARGTSTTIESELQRMKDKIKNKNQHHPEE
ncbi:ABC transporter ATP-binding protein [candidate division CSSED10-310 bacterium]|uniref:ABC transporter ATP-binding protein n=1 Tax=candidate division CSSED10-310 bacterium TaxID=2855610 RepID=A0ABV6Z5E8_UNCC1